EPIILVESRRKRSDFLVKCAATLGLQHVRVYPAKIEQMPPLKAGIISARAFAPLPRLLSLAWPFADNDTHWLLPKGKSAHEELALAQKTWQGIFEMKPSRTQHDAQIIVATAVRPKR
ncbi:MAG: class I SAM-dependent methyltransferase, partial [Alphaproteobacteria bacterium]|nr:class I SAM-dependent methyltransferase [Alphaproteobacteria bacterium]